MRKEIEEYLTIFKIILGSRQYQHEETFLCSPEIKFQDISKINEEINEEINNALKRFERASKYFEEFEISRGIFFFAAMTLRNIPQKIIEDIVKFPIPRFHITEDSIDLEWKTVNFSLLLSFTEYTEDITVYKKEKDGKIITGIIEKDNGGNYEY